MSTREAAQGVQGRFPDSPVRVLEVVHEDPHALVVFLIDEGHRSCLADCATVITATSDWSLERAATEMAHRRIRHLVIVERGQLIGILSMRDIMRVWTSEGATSAMTSG